MLFLVAALAKSQETPSPDPMQQFWWPRGCADGPKPMSMAMAELELELEESVPGPGPGCCMTRAPTDSTYGNPCVFPFKFNGVEYNACTYVKSEYLWCATQVDDEGDMVPNR